MQFRNLPSVDRLMAAPPIAAAAATHPRPWVIDLVRAELDAARQRIRQGAPADGLAQIAAQVCRRIDQAAHPQPRPVINATGVVIHTNLGRAPLSRAAIHAAHQAAAGYSNLEYDLDSGQRGGRYAQLESLLQQLTGAEAALAVNNNAAAILLGLSALAAGRQVIVSRAEAVEIGGGFRIPDVLQQSGAALIDIGATNRTYLRDYQDATTSHTAAYLKVHASNFRIQGFTAEVDPQQLAALADRLGVAALHDVGSGSLLPTENYGLAHEPMPQESIRAGMGLVFFSGDKLLGGPQAGIIAGRRPLVAQLARHPLARAVRLDKLSLAALNATLTHYLRHEAEQEIPIWQMISATPESLHQRARQWQQQLCPEPHNIPPRYAVIESQSAIGGGSLPGETLPTWTLALDPSTHPGGAAAITRQLRQNNPPIIARIENNRILFDPRTVPPNDDAPLLAALRTLPDSR